jgi:hypothetical protein
MTPERLAELRSRASSGEWYQSRFREVLAECLDEIERLKAENKGCLCIHTTEPSEFCVVCNGTGEMK